MTTNFKTLTTVELLKSFNNGQGKTIDLPEIASIENNVLKYENNQAEVNQQWLEAFTLMNLHKELKDSSLERQNKLFKAYSEGRLSLNHTDSETSVKTTKTPLNGHVLTSDEYRNNCIKLAATFENLETIFNKVNSIISNSSATKVDLMAVLTDISLAIVSNEQQTIFSVMQDKEANFSKVKAELSALCEVSFISETKVKAIAKPANLDSVISSFTALGYVQRSVDFDSKTMSMVCFFDNEKV